MLRNYFKVAWRNLLKNKGFSIINITGLATGLGCFILIALYVADELSFDRFNKKADRIYRVDSDIIMGGTNLNLAVASDPMGATLKKRLSAGGSLYPLLQQRFKACKERQSIH